MVLRFGSSDFGPGLIVSFSLTNRIIYCAGTVPVLRLCYLIAESAGIEKEHLLTTKLNHIHMYTQIKDYIHVKYLLVTNLPTYTVINTQPEI
jgi:hypothetical protein